MSILDSTARELLRVHAAKASTARESSVESRDVVATEIQHARCIPCNRKL